MSSSKPSARASQPALSLSITGWPIDEFAVIYIAHKDRVSHIVVEIRVNEVEEGLRCKATSPAPLLPRDHILTLGRYIATDL